MFTSQETRSDVPAPAAIIPVGPAAGTGRAPSIATRGLLRRTLGNGTCSRRTLGKKNKLSRAPAARSLRTRARWALLALTLAGSFGGAALTAPTAASAATVNLGPGGLSPSNQGVYPTNGGLYPSGPLKGCQLIVGDHYRTDGRAAGQGNIWCNAAHNYSMTVYIDYSATSWGPLHTATSNTYSWTGAAGTWYYDYTNGMCNLGGPATTYWWTTYVKISIDGSSWLGWFTSAQNVPYKIPAC